MIQVSNSASEHIGELKNKEKDSQNKALRISIKQGGCSGFSYRLDFDDKLSEKDKSFESNGVSLIIERKSLLYIMGMTLDYEGGLNGKGFIFSNPNAKDTCSCGISFGV
ncbi:MAG: iron-sulfur cluster assembly accessory protein [Bdellovibrionales bacterium]|nr:iron-sulfur cluster assembly accessory protein [Bdellovibrionales bacterium]